MENADIQQQFFSKIQERIPLQVSLSDLVSEVLNISTDSAYRKIKGEKSIDFEEIKALSLHFRISLDELLQLNNYAIMFNSGSVEANIHFHFELYLQTLLRDLAYINSFENKKIFYLNKDFPIFHFFQFPELAAFKCFFWTKSIVNDAEFLKEKFSIEKFLPSFASAAEKLNLLHRQIHSVEIWNAENINSTLHQIDYYRHAKSFLSKNDIHVLYDCLQKMISHIDGQAEVGYKFEINKPEIRGADYEVYINDFIIGDNTIMACLNNIKIVYINHGVISYMNTKDERFCLFTENVFNNLIKRSTPISGVNEKDRSRFFTRMIEKIEAKKSVLA